MSEYIRPDSFTVLNIGGERYAVNAKFDRVDYFRELGAWMLKIYDDEEGVVTFHLNEDMARTVVEEAELPIVERESMMASEHEGWLTMRGQTLDQEFADVDWDLPEE